MSSLPPISILPSKSQQPSIRVSNTANTLPPLSVGEIVEAEIIQNLNNATVLVELKGKRIAAYSLESKHAGERITVRVDQVRPSIILRLMSQRPTSAMTIANHHISEYHTNPMRLVDSLFNMSQIFNQNNLGELFHTIGIENVKAMQTMLSSLMLSDSTSGSDFFKNILITLGFFMENHLGGACRKRFGKAKAIRGATDNVKGFLTQIIDKMHAINKQADHSGMKQLISASDNTMKAIESLQIMNVALQEQEQKYLFQIPIVFPDGTGMAEIFMKYDKESEQKKGHKKTWTLHCLLSMDALGDITVEAQIEVNKVKCTIYCQDEAVRSFIQDRVEEIQEKLSALGYDTTYVGCSIRTDMKKMREQWVSIPRSNYHDGFNAVV